MEAAQRPAQSQAIREAWQRGDYDGRAEKYAATWERKRAEAPPAGPRAQYIREYRARKRAEAAAQQAAQAPTIESLEDLWAVPECEDAPTCKRMTESERVKKREKWLADVGGDTLSDYSFGHGHRWVSAHREVDE
jgi:hypothetical protein